MLLILALVQLAFAQERIESGASIDPESRIADAQSRFAEGVQRIDEDPAEARRLLLKSAQQFELAQTQGELRNGYLEYNTANAYLLAGEIGQAILHYRRARQLIPNDENLAANLALARTKVENRIESSGERQVARTIFFWHYDIPARFRAGALLGAWALLWLGCGWWLLRGWRSHLAWVIAIGFVGCAALATSLAIEHNERANQRDAVVTADSVIARTGPDDTAYGARFDKPLNEGVEVRIEEERAGWVFVRLADGREAWLPESAIERV